ncbi:MAG: hypothetical protein JOS17DRAFT_764301 [Linnemannia elongata]|nr:MAG: hypothetical protein JOS17DRAFT_764301 [Linnemannia elongata]
MNGRDFNQLNRFFIFSSAVCYYHSRVAALDIAVADRSCLPFLFAHIYMPVLFSLLRIISLVVNISNVVSFFMLTIYTNV